MQHDPLRFNEKNITQKLIPSISRLSKEYNFLASSLAAHYFIQRKLCHNEAFTVVVRGKYDFFQDKQYV